jgi:hypothetical protein
MVVVKKEEVADMSRILYARLWELVGMHFPNPASFSLNWEFV